MDSSDTQSPHALTAEQMAILDMCAEIVYVPRNVARTRYLQMFSFDRQIVCQTRRHESGALTTTDRPTQAEETYERVRRLANPPCPSQHAGPF